jgi:hypothetical protein
MFYSTHYGNTALGSVIQGLSTCDFASLTNAQSMFSGTYNGVTSSDFRSSIDGKQILHVSLKNKFSIWGSLTGSSNPFYRTFYLASADATAIAEPRWSDGTVLSSAGSLSGLSTVNYRPYYGRNISPAPLNDGWL